MRPLYSPRPPPRIADQFLESSGGVRRPRMLGYRVTGPAARPQLGGDGTPVSEVVRDALLCPTRGPAEACPEG